MVVRSFLYHCSVCCQGNFCWYILHIIFLPQFCGFVVPWHHFTLPHHPCWSIPYYKLVLKQLSSPPLYHVRYISLWFKELFSLLQSASNVNYGPRKYFMNFPMDHLTVAASPPKLCTDLSIGENIDIDMKDTGRICIPSRDLSNSHFLMSIFVPLVFLLPLRHLLEESPLPLHHRTSMYLYRTF